jgi:alpha-L-rhamnosidase
MQSSKVGILQETYKIEVKSPDGNTVWNSNEVESGISVAIPYSGPELALETRYTWSVSVTASDGKTYVSEPAFFETGADFSDVDWITTQGWTDFTVKTETVRDPFLGSYEQDVVTSEGGDAPLFRTEQALTGEGISSARLYITSLGAYEAFINGQGVQNAVNSTLAPGWTDYLTRLTYQTYDVTDYIESDTLVLSAVVGAGWYGSKMNITSLYGKAIGEAPCERSLLAKLVIKYDDGTQQVIATDTENWLASDKLSPYVKTGIYEGEVYDGRKAALINGWTKAGFDTDGWKKPVDIGEYTGVLDGSSVNIAFDYKTFDFIEAYTYNEKTDILTNKEGSAYPNGEIDNTKAVSYKVGEEITLNEGNILVVDFGQNASAVPLLTVSGGAGVDVYMQPCEVVSDGNTSSGNPFRGNLTPLAKGVAMPGAAADRSFHYILAGTDEPEEYRAEMHFCGYRYLRIMADGDVTIHRIQSQTISSIYDESSTVETSNETLNKFVDVTKWSELSNFITVMTDCPTREYRGWQGDAQLFAESSMFNFESAAFMINYIKVMNDYFDVNGTYSCLAPGASDYAFQTSRVAAWSDAGIIMPYAYYLQTGDASIAGQYWDNMSGFVAQIYDETNFLEGDKFQSGYKDYLQWGDHLALRAASTNFMNLTFTLYDNMLMAQMAELLGYKEDVEKYNSQADHVRKFMIDRYIDEEGNVNCATADAASKPMIGGHIVDNAQTALAWALKLGVYDTEEQHAFMAKKLVESIQNAGGSIREGYAENTLEVGFPGVNVLLPVTSEAGYVDIAYDLMMNTELYTPMYSTSVGATTTWESWNGYTKEKGFDPNSKNHFSYGAPVEWVYEYLLGIQKDIANPGLKNIILQPEIDEAITYANGSYESYYGTIVSDWTANDGILSAYTTVVPANTTATLYLPYTAKEAQSIEGAKYIGQEKHNGLDCAKFELESGGYDFKTDNGTVVVSLSEGYTE